MANLDGTYEVRIFYTTVIAGQTLTHRHTFDVVPQNDPIPGVLPAAVILRSKDGTFTYSLADWLTLYVEEIRPLYNTTSNFVNYELWQYDATGKNALYITGGPIALAGLSAGSTVAAQQLTVTYRTQAGYILRQQLMEPVLAGDAKDPAPFVSAAVASLALLTLDEATPVVARDNTYAIVALNASLGANEKLWRKRFR
jgi:hypothetical protein